MALGTNRPKVYQTVQGKRIHLKKNLERELGRFA
jgi:hypothetical protein